MPLNLTSYKPVVGTAGDAAQIANGLTSIETYVNGNFEPAGIKQTGATVGQVLTWDGTKWAPAAIPVQAQSVFTVPPVTIVNSAALTNLADQIIPGGTLGTTKKLRCEFLGDWLNNSGAGATVQAQIVWGGVTIYDFTTAAPTLTATRGLFWIKFTLAASVDAGHQALSNGDLRVDQGSSAQAAGLGSRNPVGQAFAGTNPIAVDSTVPQHLIVKAKLSIGNPATDLRMLHGAIEVIG